MFVLFDDVMDWKNKVKWMLEVVCWIVIWGCLVLVEVFIVFWGLVVCEFDFDWFYVDECCIYVLFEMFVIE